MLEEKPDGRRPHAGCAGKRPGLVSRLLHPTLTQVSFGNWRIAFRERPRA